MTTSRPGVLVFVTGTGTAVGKTWWTAATAAHLRARGIRVAARKPAQSGDPGSPTDAEALAAATGEDAGDVCPAHRTYPLAWAPPMAAERLGLPAWTAADLAHETRWPEGVAVGFVEGAGGPRSPLAADGDSADLACALAPDLVVLVADAALGAINAVRLAVVPFAGLPVAVALNRFGNDALHHANRDVLAADGLDVYTDVGAFAEHVAALASSS